MRYTFFKLKPLHIAAVVLAGALSQIAFTAPAAATVMTYDFTTSDGATGHSNYGTVTVSDNSGGGVHVDVALTSGVNFATTGALSYYSFVFSLTGDPNITVANLTSGFTAADTTGGTPNISAGPTFGYYDYGIKCTACGSGLSGSPHSAFSFDITNPSVSTALFSDGLKKHKRSTTTTPSGIYFVADVGSSGCNTGRVGAPQNINNLPPPPPPLPEPGTLALFGGALAGLGALRRRRKKKA